MTESDYFIWLNPLQGLSPSSTIPIAHVGLAKVWKESISPRYSVRPQTFISALLDEISAKLLKGESLDDQHKRIKGEQVDTGNVTKLSRFQLRQIFGVESVFFEEYLSLAIDVDSLGHLTPMKLNNATKSIPPNTPLVEAVYILLHQRGKILIPSVLSLSIQKKNFKVQSSSP